MPICGPPDKAFTPHPAVVRGCLMRRLPRLIMPTSSMLCVGRIRRLRRIRRLCADARCDAYRVLSCLRVRYSV
ncbi:hypothetical protein CXP54_23040 [Escherichia albertii]|nr:hypothetical protein CXP54_23040 [Escherichia albertii]